MRECAYDSAFMFKYSERPGTDMPPSICPTDVSGGREGTAFEQIECFCKNELLGEATAAVKAGFMKCTSNP